jgi:hypothetical protein
MKILAVDLTAVKLIRAVPAVSVMLAALAVAPAFGQAPPPMLPPPQLDQLVSRIALYPDPLIAQILAGATYPDQIQPAAMWADQHHYLTGAALASAIQADQLPWDPSVQALLPFPSVLEMMNADMNWTTQIGNAFLAQQPDVMDAVQRERVKARDFGYLRTNGQIVVGGGPYITILPVNPAFICVPFYDPAIVFFAPRPGFAIGGAISFNFGITIGAFFRPWGWGVGRFDWGAHAVFINDHAWGRTWANRATYVHPYEGIRRPGPGAVRPAEAHKLQERSPAERDAARKGQRAPREEHRER